MKKDKLNIQNTYRIHIQSADNRGLSIIPSRMLHTHCRSNIAFVAVCAHLDSYSYINIDTQPLKIDFKYRKLTTSNVSTTDPSESSNFALLDKSLGSLKILQNIFKTIKNANQAQILFTVFFFAKS